MKANVLFNINDLRYTDVPEPKLKEGEALIKVKAAGICGSDISRVFKTGTYHFPTIIGHEFSGIVVKVKDTKNSSWVGKRVGIFPLKPCFKCESCQNNIYELCSNYDYLGSRCDGGFAEYVAVPIWNLIELPDNVDFATAAMIEPAAVAMHALKISQFQPNNNIVVIGPGTIGIILCKLALLSGASNVYLIGRTQEKLDFAYSLGINKTCNSTQTNVKEWIDSQTNNKGIDIVFEGTGASNSLELGLDIVKKSGTIVTLGNPSTDISLSRNSYWKILRKQLSVKGTWNSRFKAPHNDWEEIIKLLESQQLEISKLITHRFPLEKLSEGLDIMRNPNIYSNKVMIIDDEDAV